MTAVLKNKGVKIFSLAFIALMAMTLCTLIAPEAVSADSGYLSGYVSTTQMGGVEISTGGSLSLGLEIPAIITSTPIGGSVAVSGEVDAGHQHATTLGLGGMVGFNTDQQVGVVAVEGGVDTIQAGYVEGVVGGDLSLGLGIAEITINPTVIDIMHGHQTEAGLAGGFQFDFPVIPAP